jgi:hypothetical protein
MATNNSPNQNWRGSIEKKLLSSEISILFPLHHIYANET